MNKIWKVILTLLLVCCFCGVALAHDEAVQPPQQLKVGFFKYRGFNEIDAAGFKRGYGYDLLQMLAGYGNFTYEYLGYDANWLTLEDMLERGEIDLIVAATPTPERKARFIFTENAIGADTGILTTTVYQNKIIAGDYSTYKGIRVGLMRGGVQTAQFLDFAKRNNISFVPVYYDTLAQQEQALKENSEVDALATSNARVISDEVVLETFSANSTYIMLNKNNDKLRYQLDNAINKLNVDTPDWQAKLYSKYFGANTAYIPLSSEEQDFINKIKQQGRKLKVLINPDMRPYSYFEDHVAKGIVVDYLEQICKLYGLELEYIETPTATASYKAVLTSNPDIVVAAALRYGYAETLGYLRTRPFLNTSVGMLVKQNAKAEDVKKVAIVRGINYTEKLPQELYAGKEFVFFNTMDDSVAALRSGKVDAALMYSYSAVYYLNTDWLKELKLLESSRTVASMVLAMPRSADSHLYTLLCKGIGSVPEASLQADISKYLASASEAEAPAWVYVYRHPLPVLLAILLVLCMLLYMQRQHEKMKRMCLEEQQRRDLEKVNAELHIAMVKAETDAMTGLLNKVSTQNMVEKALPAGGILFLMDLDNFKQVNDTMGHPVGDQLLIRFSETMRRVFRGQDIVGRIGGDEFLAFMGDTTMTDEQLCYKVDMIKEAMNAATLATGSASLGVSVSVGILRVPFLNGANFEKVYELVDKELYEAKRKGKNTYVISTFNL